MYSRDQRSIFGKRCYPKYNGQYAKKQSNKQYQGMYGDHLLIDEIGELYNNHNLQIMDEIKSLLYSYSLGHMEELEDELTRERFLELAEDIQCINTKTRLGTFLKEFYERALEGIMKSIMEYQKCLISMQQLEEACKYEQILKDPEKLKVYIEQLHEDAKKSTHLFNTTVNASITSVLKPEYAEYVLKYGFPEGGIFEAEKITKIRLNLC